MIDGIDDHFAKVLPIVTALRRDLHTHPELSLKEHETGCKVRRHLAGLPGIRVLPSLMGTDVVAILNENTEGRCIALRADMDALPIEEDTDPAIVPYRSIVPGVMHACGHDGHVAVLVGTAMVLSRMADQVPGKVKFIFQPAEEGDGGARILCEKGVMEDPKVDGILALHAWPSQPVGMISLRYGPAMAASCSFFITVRGQGSHGAYPQRGIDPVVIAAHIVTGLQTIVARTVAPVDSAVVTVGALWGGTATNIIPPECRMKGTLRYLKPEVGEHLQRRVKEIAEHTALAHGATAEVRFEPGYPPVTNNERMCRLVENTVRDIFGADRIFTEEPPSMGVEDFSYYGEYAPGMMFRLGVRPKEMDCYPSLHNPQFNYNDDASPAGIRLFCELVMRFLRGGC